MSQQPDILELLEKALELSDEERQAFFAELEASSPELRRELEEILASEDDVESQFLGAPAVAAFSDLVDGGDPEALLNDLPETIGPYRVLSLLGEGGMGSVYLAEQREPVHRTVAIKLIRAGLSSPSAVMRFDAERQAMARLSHPCIAQMLAGGTTDDGFPYFVMERVEGTDLTRFCDHERLTLRQRLELFVEICRGVEHAHRKGILHRDLKPSNILVQRLDGKAEPGGEPVPKIIDFGIAKAITGHLTDETLKTHFGIGTPNYMSPESFVIGESGSADVDTRSDVYALGVILYQLLVGEPPIDTRGSGFSKVVKQISDEVAPSPATLFERLPLEKQAGRAKQRRLRPEALKRALRGELAWIVARALEKERDRRYGSAGRLADDVKRYLRHEPVSVGPPSRIYRASRWARRRPGLAAGLVIGAGALLLGSLGTTQGMLRAQREADRAGLEAERARDALIEAEEVTEFLVELFNVSDPREAGGETLSARELLARGETQVAERLAGRPLHRAELLGTLSDAYSRLGLYDDAARLAAEAVELQADRLPADHPDRVLGLKRKATLEAELSLPTSANPESPKL